MDGCRKKLVHNVPAVCVVSLDLASGNFGPLGFSGSRSSSRALESQSSWFDSRAS